MEHYGRRSRPGSVRRLVGVLGLAATCLVAPPAPATDAPVRAWATGFCEIVRFHPKDRVEGPFTDSFGQWCANQPSAEGTLRAVDVTLSVNVSAAKAAYHLSLLHPASKGFQAVTGYGDQAVAATYAPFPDSSEVNHVLAYVRSCYYVRFTSYEYPPSDEGWTARIATMQDAARQLDLRLQQAGSTYGLPTCTGGTGDTTATTGSSEADDLVNLIVEGGAFTRAELMQILGDGFADFPIQGRVTNSYWLWFLGQVSGSWYSLHTQAAKIVGGGTGVGSLDATQTAALDTFRIAVLLGTAQPQDRYEFPVVTALLPVLTKMTSNAIGPPSDAEAGRALNRLVRMAIADQIPSVSTTPPS